MSITIFLADDHTIVRDGLQVLLERQPDLQVVGSAASGHETVRQVAHLCPDIAIIDVAMPELNGIDAAQQIHGLCPNTRIIILSMHTTTEHIFRALKAGVHGYLAKESAGAELIDAVRTVQAGQRYLSSKISNIVVNNYLYQYETDTIEDPLMLLSAREREVMQLIVEGKSTEEIAHLLSLSINTVNTYRSRLMHKLAIHDLPTLVKFALRHGLISLD